MEEKKKLKTSTIIGYVVSFLSLILCLYITIEVINANNNRRPPRIFGLSVSHVPTDSMEPTITAGEYVLFIKADFDDVKKGDIVVYRDDDDKFIIHRVIEKDEDSLKTQGDNNPVDDGDISPDRIYGKYIMTLEFMNIFSSGINKNFIYFILIGIFLIMIFMQAASVFIKNKTKEVKENAEEQKNLLREEMRKQILEEELKRLREENQKLKVDNKKPEEPKEEIKENEEDQ